MSCGEPCNFPPLSPGETYKAPSAREFKMVNAACPNLHTFTNDEGKSVSIHIDDLILILEVLKDSFGKND